MGGLGFVAGARCPIRERADAILEYCISLEVVDRPGVIADIAGAMSLEALKGTVRAFDERVVAARPHPGQIAVGALLRALLAAEGPSAIAESHKNCGKTQDPYSLRCMPQVHGASRDVIGYARGVLEREAAASTDNPLVFVDDALPDLGDMISGGNFHGQPVALALDAADRIISMTYPGASPEVVTVGYNTAGQPITMTGTLVYVAETQYTAWGAVDQRKLGAAGPSQLIVDPTYYAWDGAPQGNSLGRLQKNRGPLQFQTPKQPVADAGGDDGRPRREGHPGLVALRSPLDRRHLHMIVMLLQADTADPQAVTRATGDGLLRHRLIKLTAANHIGHHPIGPDRRGAPPGRKEGGRIESADNRVTRKVKSLESLRPDKARAVRWNADLWVLFQDENRVPSLGQPGRRLAPCRPRPHHDHIEMLVPIFHSPQVSAQENR